MASDELKKMSGETEEAYLSALDSRLSVLAEKPGVTFLDILRGARGAYPTLVLERLKVLGMDKFLPPELHPLDFEWYFTSDCASQIAEFLAGQGGDVLCLAAPTAASAIARRGRRV